MKEDRQRRFMEREAKMRAMVRKAKEFEIEPVDSRPQAKNTGLAKSTLDKLPPPPMADSTREQDIADDKTTGPRLRPMWALTEQQALKAVDCAEIDEADNLLDFANGLDFDKYINDTEVSALIENVRSRIAELEANRDVQAKLELPTPHQANKSIIDRSRMKLTADNLGAMSDQGTDITSDKCDDCASLARLVLEADAGKVVGGVHSHKSLTAVAERSKYTLSETRGILSEEAVPPPLVMKHTDDAGARLEGKNSVSNLPYMHRNPAV